jgi:IS30 family transposase
VDQEEQATLEVYVPKQAQRQYGRRRRKRRLHARRRQLLQALVSNQIRQSPDSIITILLEKKDQYRLLLDLLKGQTVKARIRP